MRNDAVFYNFPSRLLFLRLNALLKIYANLVPVGMRMNSFQQHENLPPLTL